MEKVESPAKVHVFYIDYGNVSGGAGGGGVGKEGAPGAAGAVQHNSRQVRAIQPLEGAAELWTPLLMDLGIAAVCVMGRDPSVTRRNRHLWPRDEGPAHPASLRAGPGRPSPHSARSSHSAWRLCHLLISSTSPNRGLLGRDSHKVAE